MLSHDLLVLPSFCCLFVKYCFVAEISLGNASKFECEWSTAIYDGTSLTTNRERVTERVSVQNKTNANGFLEACVINTPEKKNKAKKRTEQSNCNDQQHNALYLSCSMLCGDVNWSAFFLSATKCVTLVLRFALCSECF